MPEYNKEYYKGLDLIVEERMRQSDVLGYTIEHDGENHTPAELMRIGTCYIDWATTELEFGSAEEEYGEAQHPYWPPDTTIPWKPEPSAIETAVKGAAFVAAALDLMFAEVKDG